MRIPEPSLVQPEITVPEVKEAPLITAQRIENLEDTMCSELCRWPYEYKDQDDLWSDKCDHCEILAFLEEVRERV